MCPDANKQHAFGSRGPGGGGAGYQVSKLAGTAGARREKVGHGHSDRNLHYEETARSSFFWCSRMFGRSLPWDRAEPRHPPGRTFSGFRASTLPLGWFFAVNLTRFRIRSCSRRRTTVVPQYPVHLAHHNPLTKLQHFLLRVVQRAIAVVIDGRRKALALVQQAVAQAANKPQIDSRLVPRDQGCHKSQQLVGFLELTIHSFDLAWIITVYNNCVVKQCLWHGFFDEVFGADFSSDGRKLVVAAGGQEAIRLYDTANWQATLTLECEQRGLWPTMISPDDNVIGATPIGGGRLQLWRLPSLADIEAAESQNVTNSPD